MGNWAINVVGIGPFGNAAGNDGSGADTLGGDLVAELKRRGHQITRATFTFDFGVGEALPGGASGPAGLSSKYGRVTVSRGELGADEPVFVLRAADKLAAVTVSAYADRAEAAGCVESFVDAVREVARRMRDWPVKKLPD